MRRGICQAVFDSARAMETSNRHNASALDAFHNRFVEVQRPVSTSWFAQAFGPADTCYFLRTPVATPMKLAGFFVSFVALSLALPWARADLTIVQSVEGSSGSNEMTMKLKGDKMRIDVSPQVTTIIDAKTGEMINLMNDQKKVMRISGEKVRATMELAQQFKTKSGKKETKEKSKFVATGKKETINGYETEQYTWETPEFKATYWIALNYPDGGVILKQLQAINPDIWKTSNTQMPDYRDFPGLPIKTLLLIGGSQITTTLTAVKQDPLSDADFTIPKDYQEMKFPEMSDLLQQNATRPPATAPSPE